jgi:hypothetical protein
MGLFDRFKKKPEPGQTTDQVIATLEILGYFAFIDPQHLQQLKAELGKGLVDGRYLPYVDEGPPAYKGIDPRHYNLDNETLFEEGGIVESLEEMAPFFAKMNIPMDISEHVEEWDPKTGLDHRITLNGKPYTIFDQWQNHGWCEAAQRFADIVNDQLAIQGSNERMYLVHGSNDGRAIFLTEELYAFIRPLIDDIRERPMPTKEWSEYAGITWQSVAG